MLLAPWSVCIVDWQIWKWSLLPKHGSRNKPYALLSHGKEKNTSESLEIQRGLHDISVLITLFCLMTLKCMMIDLPNQIHYFTYLSLAIRGVHQAICNAASLLVWWPVYFWRKSLETIYRLCAWMLLQPIHMPVKIICSFLSKSLSTIGQGCRMHPENLPQNLLCSMPIVTALM
jgi:hypothetical protein